MKIMTNDRAVAVLVEEKDMPDGPKWASFPIDVQETDEALVFRSDGVADGFYPPGTFESREGWREVPETGGEPMDMAIRELVRTRLAYFARMWLTSTS